MAAPAPRPAAPLAAAAVPAASRPAAPAEAKPPAAPAAAAPARPPATGALLAALCGPRRVVVWRDSQTDRPVAVLDHHHDVRGLVWTPKDIRGCS